MQNSWSCPHPPTCSFCNIPKNIKTPSTSCSKQPPKRHPWFLPFPPDTQAQIIRFPKHNNSFSFSHSLTNLQAQISYIISQVQQTSVDLLSSLFNSLCTCSWLPGTARPAGLCCLPFPFSPTAATWGYCSAPRCARRALILGTCSTGSISRGLWPLCGSFTSHKSQFKHFLLRHTFPDHESRAPIPPPNVPSCHRAPLFFS